MIVLGGTRTEPQYFEYVKRELRAGGLDIQIVAEGWTPKTLYELAVKLREDEQRIAKKRGDADNVYDEVWVVSDVDEFVDELKGVIERARGSGIRLAITNPCFEAWLSMHVSDSAAKLTRHQAQSLAKTQGLVESARPKHIVVEMVRGKFDLAASRARKLAAAHSAADTVFPHDIPSSDVDLLVGGMRDYALRSNPGMTTQL